MVSRYAVKGMLVGGMVATVALLGGCSKSNNPVNPGGTTGGSFTVTGMVVGTLGEPIASVPVVIPGKPPATTSSNGSFSISGVTSPYDLIAVDGSAKRAFVYKGLTRSDPTVVLIGTELPGVIHQATVSGSLAGSGYPEPPNTTSAVAFGSATGLGSTVTSTSGGFRLGVRWTGADSTSGTVYGLEWQTDPASGLPARFTHYGKKAGVVLHDGGTLTGVADTLDTLQTSSVSGSVTVASGLTLTQQQVTVSFAGKAAYTFFGTQSPAANFSYPAPSTTGLTLTLTSIAVNTAGESSVDIKPGIAPGTSGVSIVLPDAPHQSLPVNNSTGVDTSSVFAWSAVQGAVYDVTIEAGSTEPAYELITASTSVSIPNLASLGLALPPGVVYTWRVTAYTPVSSVDAVATPGVLTAEVFLNPPVEVTVASSAFLSFTSHL